MNEPPVPSDPDDRAALVARERAFHDDRYQDDQRGATAKYYAVDSGRDAYATLVEAAAVPGARVLEYGCGTGSLGPALAVAGADVTGIDISPVAIAEASAVADAVGVPAGTARFLVMDAHHLEFPDASFDLVCGSGILHHLDLDAALPEVARVLRPGGAGVFYEPLGTNPLINLYRRLTPGMRTLDEHPLVPADIAAARRWFGSVEWEVHTFLALAGAVLGRLGPAGRLAPTLVRADRWLFRRLPWTRRFAWVVVLRLGAPRSEAAG